MSSYLYNSFNTINDDYSIHSNRNKYFSNSPDDFVPREFQIELANLCRNYNKIIFLPSQEDKYLVTILLIQSLANEVRRSNNRIIYFVDSAARGNEVTTCLRKHTSLKVASVSLATSEDKWCLKTENNNVLIVHCEPSHFPCNRFHKLIPSCKLLVFDDCIHGLRDGPMKNVLDEWSSLRVPKSYSVLGLTSVLIDNYVHLDGIYTYLIELEKVYNASIITSFYSEAMKKYVANSKIKLVKYRVSSDNQFSHKTQEQIESLIDSVHVIIDNFYFDDNLSSVKNELKLILECLKDSMNFGAYPMFISISICRIRLEKIKLKYWASSLIPVTLSMTSDLNVLGFLLKEEIENSGSMENIEVIMKKCNWKFQKLFPLFLKMRYEQRCVVIVKDLFVAQLVTYFLQSLNSIDHGLEHIKCEFLIDDRSLEFFTDREKLLRQKKLRLQFKQFQRSDSNVFVTSWQNLIDTTSINSDWIMYFDLPPDLKSYFISQKFGNTIENEHFFFHEELNTSELKNKLEPYGRFNSILKEVFEKKCYPNLTDLGRSFIRFQTNCIETQDFSSLVTKSNKEANLTNSISIVNKFCSCLPRDAFSTVSPRWRILNECDGAVCELQFPIQCSLKLPIQTAPLTDIKFLKPAVALHAVKMLYKNGLLNENLLPSVHRLNRDLLNDETLYPHWRSEEDGKNTGSSEVYRIVPLSFPEWFRKCASKMNNYYLHVLHTQPKCEVPDCPRKKHFYDLLNSKHAFGIVTATPLPKVCQFPVFMDLGEVNVSVEVNASNLSFTSDEIKRLHSFHRFVLLEILEAIKGFLVADDSDEDNAYYLVPLMPLDAGNMCIDWEVVNNLSVKNKISEPTEHERIHTEYYEKTYIGKVVVPWYRVFPQRFYIVTNVLSDLTPYSPFTTREYDSFAEYYTGKYNLELKQSRQPLLEARAISNTLNCIRPVAVNPGVRRKRGERAEDFDETLIPEFCIIQSFPAVYWYKSISLLAVMHRLHYILIAETIRRRIAFDSMDVLSKSLPQDEDVLVADPNCLSELDEMSKSVIPISSILKDVKSSKAKRSYVWGNEQVPLDPERDLKKVCTLELMVYHDFIRKSNVDVHEPPMVRYAFNLNFKDDMFNELGFDCPQLKFLKLSQDLSSAPKQTDILKAITLPESGDIIDLELYKFVGNSLLKFASTYFLWKFYSDLNVFQLTFLRRKLIKKRNLYYCSSKLQLSSIVKLQDFSTCNDWKHSGFCIPELLMKVIKNSVLKPGVIFNLEIPVNEQISGVISPETRNEMQDKMLNYHSDLSNTETNNLMKDSTNPSDTYNHVLVYLKKQSVPDKAVVDSLKALAGVYLMNGGIRSGFKFLQLVDILKRDISIEDLLTASFQQSNSQDGGTFENITEFCRIISYTFKYNELLVQVFTHHSCIPEYSSECNQKLAFLGDSILDLLITGFIFEYNSSLSISEIQDLRVALFNDVIFSVLLVRTGLYKFLSVESTLLIEKIDEFVSRQERVQHKFDNNELLFLVEETSNHVTKSVDAPKALSDAFKALIAAVFLDSGGDLATVWNVCYNMMKNEINLFSNEIPKNPVKLLAETDLLIEYEKPEIHEHDANLVEVEMRVHIDQTVKYFLGVGSGKREASRIAAKLALKRLSKEFTL